MLQTLIEYANSLTPNLDNDRISLWLKTGHYKYLRATYTAGQAEEAVIQPLKPNSPSTIELEQLEEQLGNAITWQELYERTGKIDGGLFYYPQMPVGLPLGEYAVSAGDLITIESDHATVEDQQAILQKFEEVTRLKFFAKIFSGKKSIHANLGLDDRMNWEEGDYLSKLCFLAFLSDPSLGSHAAIARYPGGMRKSKDGLKTQDLLEHSQSRYSYAIVKAAIQSFYLVQHGVSAPESIPPLWWAEVRKRLLQPDRHGDPKEMIVKGVEAWQQERDAEQKAIDAERNRLSKEYNSDPRSEKSFRGKAWAAIVEARKAVPTPVLKNGHNTGDRQSDNRSRTIGFCPLHGGNSGSSARVRIRNGEARFACWTCTFDGTTRADVDMLEYAYLESGASFQQLPRGRNADDWLILPQLENFARDFCRRNGVEMPEREPIDRTVKKKLKAVEGQPKVVQQEKSDPKPDAKPSKVVEHKAKSSRWDPSLVRKELEAIVSKGLNEAEQDEEFISLCDRAGYNQNEIFKLFQSVKTGEEEVDLNDRFSYLDSNKSADYLLPMDWYTEVSEIYASTGINFFAIQAPILTVVSSLISRTRLCLKPSSGWWIPPQIWNATLGRPGSKKSFIVGIAGKPLIAIDKENLEKSRSERARWKQRQKEGGDKEPAPPFIPRHCMQEFTLEALEKQLIVNNGVGVSIVTDELKAWFGSMGRYSKSGDHEAARWCQLYEGDTYSRDRAADFDEDNGEQGQYVHNPIVAVCGAVQPDVVIRKMGETQKDGLVDRILWTKAPPKMDEIEYDDPELEDLFFNGGHKSKYPLYNRLRHLYEVLMSSNAGLNLRLDAEAKAIYKEFFDKMSRLGNQENIPALQPLYAKHQMHAAKLAMSSHMIKMAAGEFNSTDLSITRETMEAAVALAEHSLVIALELWLESQDSLNCEVIARKILESSQGQTIDWSKVRTLGRSNGNRNGQAFKKAEVIKIFNYMAVKGYGTRNGDKFTVN